MSAVPSHDLHHWLSRFTLADFLRPHVAEVFRQGYTLRGTVIRPASVRVERKD